MGIFKTAANHLSTFFAGAPKAEIDAANAALRDVHFAETVKQDEAADLVIHDELTFKPNRKQRRDYSHSFRQRTRNSAFSRRDKVATPKAQHEQANSKGWQYASNLLLQSLVLPSKEAQVAA